ncbi:GNAT family N-acetyltransferase [Streptomyces sp. NPDC021218]|uniref:GNAT family N-acetyltransferase n=1 Tax=Streptomyces sp. NPDC021218 TaxID=3365119 RepID=UPI00378B5FC0
MHWDEEYLLRLEVDTVHGLVAGGGEAPPTVRDEKVDAVFAWSPRARVLALGHGVQDPGPVSGPEQEYAPGDVPRVLVRLSETLGGGTDTIEGGPCFVFPQQLTAGVPAPLPVIVSDAAGREAAGRLLRPDNWEPGEWGELTRGEMGEWAMAVHDDSPVSICFSPARNAVAAEAGIWTRADFRGRRIAPAVVAAWSQRERRHKKVLFYSTTAANRASQSVARTLGLVPLGWIWTVPRTSHQEAASSP